MRDEQDDGVKLLHKVSRRDGFSGAALRAKVQQPFAVGFNDQHRASGRLLRGCSISNRSRRGNGAALEQGDKREAQLRGQLRGFAPRYISPPHLEAQRFRRFDEGDFGVWRRILLRNQGGIKRNAVDLAQAAQQP